MNIVMVELMNDFLNFSRLKIMRIDIDRMLTHFEWHWNEKISYQFLMKLQHLFATRYFHCRMGNNNENWNFRRKQRTCHFTRKQLSRGDSSLEWDVNKGNEQFPRQTFVVIKRNKCSVEVLKARRVFPHCESLFGKMRPKFRIFWTEKLTHCFYHFMPKWFMHCVLLFAPFKFSLCIMCAINEWMKSWKKFCSQISINYKLYFVMFSTQIF